MKKLILTFLVMLLAGYVQAASQTSGLTGVWKFEVEVNRLVGRDGFIKSSNVSYEWIIRLKQQGGKVTGEIIGGRGGTRQLTPCKDAAVNGSIRGEDVSFVISWQGTCCGDEQSRFKGQIKRDGSITGSVEPIDIPNGYSCSLEYGDVVARRRGSDSDDDDPERAGTISNLGVWDFQVDVNRMVGRDGFIKRVSTTFELVVRLNQRNGKITGEIVGGRGGRRGETVCADADLEGSLNGNRFSFVVTFRGSCCTNEQLRYTGQFGNNFRSLTGTVEPVDVPKGYTCSLEYGDFNASKR